MAKIIYSVLGEGRGHSSRSKVAIEHLIEKGHDVYIASSKKGYAYLKKSFDKIIEIPGLEFVYDKDKVDYLKTLQKNIDSTILKSASGFKKLETVFKTFKPDIVISDFDPFTPFFAKIRGIPFLSVSHQHMVCHTKIDYPYSWRNSYIYARGVTENMYWFAEKYFITSFFFPKVKDRIANRVELVGPILRNEVLDQESHDGDHILVYGTYSKNDSILKFLRVIKEKFIVYGFDNDEKKINNLFFKKPSTESFLRDLANSKAVFTNGGYSLISEALYFKKPVFSTPLTNQFEQLMNAYYLEKAGYGLFDLNVDIDRIYKFLRGLDYFKTNISADKHLFNGNKKFFKLINKEIRKHI